ncbi:hypothetical protein CERSUDRAFT_114386 [Gelatoporia subvermispora B]|uniref:Methyltransferase n=1 Tax=Ceriporiopsis subvermispora (strain B) TaxID=914234 RepID=M2RG05_CERS8|nr:hypothetical protein CERSUDRAFT_114386 [Gelatoporia subvermispora B]
MSETVTAKLVYFTPPADGSRPYTLINTPSDPNIPRQNYKSEEHDVLIENIRGKEGSVSLDTAGYQFFRRPSAHKGFTDKAAIEAEYYKECIELVKELTGASRAVVFDHTVRRHNPEDKEDTPEKRQPVPRVHVDQTPSSARRRVEMHLPSEDVPHLLQRRFQIINLWRPISVPAFDWPLALCDYRSINYQGDLVPTALRYPDRDGETFGVKFNPDHKWKYVKGMTPEEFVLIKCYDSQEDGKTALLTPHTAFQDPTTPKDAPLRQSIEVRLLVFYD